MMSIYNHKYTIDAEQTMRIENDGRVIILHRIVYSPEWLEQHRLDRSLLGGWVENDFNLSQYDQSLLLDYAMAFDKAYISDSAIVRDHAIVCNQAKVYGHALVCDAAIVESQAQVHGYGIVRNMAIIQGRGKVNGHGIVEMRATVFASGQVTDYAIATEEAIVEGHAALNGNMCIRGHAILKGDKRCFSPETRLKERANKNVILSSGIWRQNGAKMTKIG